jgi:hypothetical protein
VTVKVSQRSPLPQSKVPLKSIHHTWFGRLTSTNGEERRTLAEQIETSINTLATETDAVRKSQTFLNWLDAMAKFSSYSPNNQILILLQEWVT